MGLIDRLKSWLRPDPADALKAAEYEPLLPDEAAALRVETTFWVCAAMAIPSLVRAEMAHRQHEADSPTPQHPNEESEG